MERWLKVKVYSLGPQWPVLISGFRGRRCTTMLHGGEYPNNKLTITCEQLSNDSDVRDSKYDAIHAR